MFLKKIEIVYLLLCITWIISNDVFSFNLPLISFIFPVILMTPYLKSKNILNIFFITIPFAQALPYNFLFFYLFSLVFFYNYTYIYFNKSYIYLLFIVIIELINTFLFEKNLTDFITSTYLLVFPIILLNKSILIKSNLNEIVYYFIIAVFLSYSILTINIFTRIIIAYDLEIFLNRGYRLGTLIPELIVMNNFIFLPNPNTIALNSIVAISLFITYRNIKIPLITIVAIFLFGFLTFSKAFILSNLILFLFSLFKIKISFFLLFRYILITILVLFLSQTYFPSYISNILERFSYDLFTGRDDILFEYINNFFSSPNFFLFGVGISNYQVILGIKYSLHFALIEPLIYWGFFGFVVFVFLIVSIFPTKLIIKDLYLPIIVFIAFISVNQLISVRLHFLLFILLILTFKQKILRSKQNLVNVNET